MSAYSLYGLTIDSEWELPGIPVVSEGADVFLRRASQKDFDSVRDLPAVEPQPRLCRYVSAPDGSSYVCWPNLFEFLISPDGRKILGRSLSRTSQEAFSTYLLGQVLSFALLKQGVEQLHCTAVVINGKAACVLGDCGYGKSTLGAFLARSGYRLLTDDLLVLKRSANGYLAFPGPARVKLFPENAAWVLGRPAKGVPMNPFTSKLIIPLDQRHSATAPVPVGAVYVLNDPSLPRKSKQITIRRLAQKPAFVKLLRHTFNNISLEPKRLQQLFQFSAELASHASIRSLAYPRKLASLPAVREAVVANLAREFRA